jgi:hypothetical protein
MILIPLPTNYQFTNLAGKKYGQLEVLCYAGKTKRIRNGRVFNGKTKWLCKCSCGNLVIVNNSDVKSGSTKSCGCDKNVKTSSRLGTHRMTYSPTYKSWAMMIQRATNKNLPYAKNYSLRGITVCEQWLQFDNFLADMGERPDNTSLDRINNDGNYEPSNCRWADRKTQLSNRRKYKTNLITTTKGT